MGPQSLSYMILFATPWAVAHHALCPWNFPGKNTAVGCHALLQRIFPIQGSNPCLLHLLHWQADCFPLRHLGSPQINYTSTKKIKKEDYTLLCSEF